MKPDKSLLVHACLLLAAGASAGFVWTREKQPKVLAQADVVVWQGRADDVARVTFELKNKKVVVESKSDAVGRYFVGTVDKDAPAYQRPDAGEGGEPSRVHVGFVSVAAGQKLAESLATLKAMRAIGKVGDDRLAEFGLAESQGEVTVALGGSEQRMTIGGPTPGSGDRYVRIGSGEIFAVKGEIVRDIESADTRLVERDLHEWKDAEVVSAKITAAGKTRELVRGGAEGKRFWADAANAGQNDETAGNWMSKLDRLKPTDYVIPAPEGREIVVRVEYLGKSGSLGFFELAKLPPSGSAKPDYLVKTERTREMAKVPSAIAEQVETDVASIIK